MSLTELARLDAERLQPRIVTLHFALARLRSCVSFMNSGAHPDDETSALLAVLGFRDGLDLSYACANRGEGGQNDIGTEALAALGTLRTAEMEKAAEVLDCRLYWLSHSPEDSITDFGFSKSGDETLQYWQHEHALKRFVSIVRREKPDILCPTFLDVPGQHGHHRAMTALAHEAMDCAADAAFKIDALPPWTISKLYLPAWGGGGSSYDDEEAPPKATLSVRADGHDELTGWTWEHIAQQSRRFHRTQNMGRWIASGSERNWPLHLAISHVDGPDETPLSGLPSTLGALAEQINDSGAVRGTLISAQQAIDDTLAAFPDFPQVALQASRALVHIHQAMDTCPDSAKRHVMHRLQRKQAQLSRVIRLALGVRVRGCITGSAQSDSASTMSSAAGFWQAGERHGFELEVDKRQADALDENCLVEASLQADAPWQLQDNALSLADTAQPSEAYPNRWLPDEPTLPRVQLRIVFEGVTSTTWHALENPPVVLPSVRATLYPNRVLINTARSTQAIDIALVNTAPDDAQATLAVDEQWKSCADEDRLQLTPPADLVDGLYEWPLILNGQHAMQTQTIAYPHITPRVLCTPATLRIRAANIQLPDTRVAYVGGGNDDVANWLVAMGLPVTVFSDDQLADAASLTRALLAVDTLVVGLFAYRSRPALVMLIDTVNAWVASGGHLVTLYHRPWDNWDPKRTPPRRLEIGLPSLRFRVTDEQATVTHLLPDHPLLTKPNTITPEDWAGWHKERGLYFAKSWDEAYEPLLSMADPGEAAHEGALLCARIGNGRHTHTALTLHHQMNQLVPGSFRLMANLVS